MEINTTEGASSEKAYEEKLSHYSRACAGLIHVRTDEIWRTVLSTRNIVMGPLGATYKEWDILSGIKTVAPTDLYKLSPDGGREALFEVLTQVVESCSDDNRLPEYIALLNPQYFWAAPDIHHALQQLSVLLPTSNTRVLLITPDIPAPESFGDGIATIHTLAPSYNELMECAKELMEGVDIPQYTDDEMRDICYAGMGMGRAAFEMHMAMGLTGTKNDDGTVPAKKVIEAISHGKTDILNQSDLLELYPAESMSNVGGMENIKEWVGKRSRCYTEAAKAHGITPPKGCVVAGLPGSGKSLLAKCVASELGVSLIRLDFGRVFNSLVGESEKRMRTALKHVESMAPCVLFVDEVDKGLGGIGSSGGDSGTSSRVLGSFLSWLNDNTKPVFTIMTANNVQGLPPELLRKGRFDEIFATGFPDAENRKEILSIHLRKRGWGDQFSVQELQILANLLKGFVGAEIEAVVCSALIDSFSKGEDLGVKHIQDAIKETTPLSKSRSKEVFEMLAWAKECAVPAGKKDFAEEDTTNVATLADRPKRRTRLKTTEKTED